MALGIWTPVALSTVQIVFGDLLKTYSDRTRTTALAAGTHMRVTNLGCYPVFIHSADPVNDATGMLGVPLCEDSEVVLPRVSPIWIYSPYEQQTILIDVGTLT